MRIALVDGPPAARHARQLLLRAEGYDVRAYASAAPLLADPLARASVCIVAQVDDPEVAAVALVRTMRAYGWHGAAIVLTDDISPTLAAWAVEQDFVVMAADRLPDRMLLAGVRAAIAGR